jgi:hypothetical protein
MLHMPWIMPISKVLGYCFIYACGTDSFSTKKGALPPFLLLRCSDLAISSGTFCVF